MAAKKTESGTRSGRFRFVLIEADLGDNNLSDLTQAITQALKPTMAPVPRVLPPPTRLPATLNGDTGGTDEPDDLQGTDDVSIEPEPAEMSPKAPSTPRGKQKYAVPEFKHDLDMIGESISFKEYAAQQSPKSTAKRYLAAAMWMKEYGRKATINIHGMYSCYKTAPWPLGINDWDQTFRTLVRSDQMRRVEPGEYAITHLGEAALQKTGA